METMDEELRNIAPRLSKIKKEQPFKAPEGYFEDFGKRLEERKNPPKETQKISLMDYIRPSIGLAASVAIIFVLLYVPLEHYLPSILEKQHSAQTIEVTESDDNILGFEDLFFMADAQIMELFNSESSTFTESDLTSEEIEQYLVLNYSDLEIMGDF